MIDVTLVAMGEAEALEFTSESDTVRIPLDNGLREKLVKLLSPVDMKAYRQIFAQVLGGVFLWSSSPQGGPFWSYVVAALTTPGEAKLSLAAAAGIGKTDPGWKPPVSKKLKQLVEDLGLLRDVMKSAGIPDEITDTAVAQLETAKYLLTT